jgi:hypothetical protein
MAGASSRCHMKPKSLCPKCGELFSRKWNMREHCRTQHHYDPDPNPRPSPIRQRNTIELIDSSVNSTGLSRASAPVEKFLNMMRDSVRFQQTGIRDSMNDSIADSMGSIENALNCLVDSFVIVRKKEFHGISGYFCKKCHSFEYKYIRNIWEETTAKAEHVHAAEMNRSVKENELRIQANNVLVELVNSLFPGDKKFELSASRTYPIHGPVIKLGSVTMDHWAGKTILCAGLTLRDSPYIYDFVTKVKGTYAQIIVESGPLKGRFLISVQPVR